ncbi:MAG: thermosome subunit alpha [Candidatus Nanoarchaeia archaeon]
MTDKPIMLMPEDIQRLIGKDAQRNNIQAARMVAEVVKTTLGPKGMDKMIVSPTDEIIITNDGVTILEEMQIEHPAAKMMVEIARTQEDEIGDGTTTAVMIAGKLLENAEKLLDQKIHPTVITKGYRIAAERCQRILNEISIKITPQDENILRQIAMTAMTGKGAEDSRERFADILVKAVKQIQDNGKVDIKDIKIEKIKGDGIKDSELISGIVFEKEKISHDMPSFVKNAKIALVGFPLELKNPEIDTKVSISSPEQLRSFIEQEEESIKAMIGKIKSSGANVVFCQKGIDDFAEYLLSKEGIFACRRVAKDDMEKISKATKAKIVNNLNELSSRELGNADIVEEKKHGNSVLTYVKGCQNPKSMTILIHGGSEHVIDEIERAMKDGLGDIICCLNSGKIVPGGGAVEIELARRLRQFGQTLSGREQLAVDEFASALEFIPITLAENAGLDPIDILTELKFIHDSGQKNIGLNLFSNRIEDTFKARIVEPSKIKSQAINSASEVAIMILRIDDVIAGSRDKKKNTQLNMNDY